MKLTIYRGTNQIGGCVTELESHGYKVFIDFGEQLPGVPASELRPIDGLTYGDVSKSRLFISHYHGDHIGKVCDTPGELAIYIGKTAKEIYNCLESRLSMIPNPQEAEKHKRIVRRISAFHTFTPPQRINGTGMSVTPLMIDHSAFDAYMFLIEGDGIRVLHTGDFRGHGFRSSSLVAMLKKYASHVDYIILEGTNICRPDVAVQTEQALQNDFEDSFRRNKHNFVLVSSTNIDRLFSLYHAAKKSGRCFVCDGYQAQLLQIVSNYHKQYTSFYNINYMQKDSWAGRFFVLNKAPGGNSFRFSDKFRKALKEYGFCMLIRASDVFKPILEEYAGTSDAKIYYSMWNGYVDHTKQAFNPALYDFLMSYSKKDTKIAIEYKHTSGHADVSTLKQVIETVSPKKGIIPIHTEAPEKFYELFGEITSVITLRDGETLDCSSHLITRADD